LRLVLNFENQTEPNFQSATQTLPNPIRKIWTQTKPNCDFLTQPKPETKHLNISKYNIFQIDGKLCYYCFWTLSFEKFWFLFDLKCFILNFHIFKEIWKKNSEKSCKIFEKWFSGSVGTQQNQTERLSQKPEPNQTQKNRNRSQL
jgi:hypothetical protein